MGAPPTNWCHPTYIKKYISERAIRTFKAHFLSVFAGVDPAFHKFMWDNLLAQTELTHNLLRQSTPNPRILLWEYFNGSFDYAETPLGPIGWKKIIHTTSNKQKSSDQRGHEGFSVVPALYHYHCIQAIDSNTKSLLIIYTAECLHEYLTQSNVKEEYRMTHTIHFLYVALKDAPNINM